MWRRMAEDRQIFRSLRSVDEATAATDSAASALFIHAAQMKCSPFVCSNRWRPTISLCLTHSLPPFMTMSMTNHGQHVKNLS